MKYNNQQIYEAIKPTRKKEGQRKSIERFVWCLSIFSILTFGLAAKKINGL